MVQAGPAIVNSGEEYGTARLAKSPDTAGWPRAPLSKGKLISEGTERSAGLRDFGARRRRSRRVAVKGRAVAFLPVNPGHLG